MHGQPHSELRGIHSCGGADYQFSIGDESNGSSRSSRGQASLLHNFVEYEIEGEVGRRISASMLGKSPR